MFNGELIRNKTPEELIAEGNAPHIAMLNESDFRKAAARMITELIDQLSTKEVPEPLDKLKDVYAVLEGLAASYGVSMDSIRKASDRDRIEHGSYTDRLFLIKENPEEYGNNKITEP